eukprot:1158343-Pelagomonas_calceolata.AAC.6
MLAVLELAERVGNMPDRRAADKLQRRYPSELGHACSEGAGWWADNVPHSMLAAPCLAAGQQMSCSADDVAFVHTHIKRGDEIP